MDSADTVGCVDSAASACAACVGDAGVGGPDRPGEPTLRFFSASACLLGGPRRLLGRSNVHGMSRAVQARHGGPDSSH